MNKNKDIGLKVATKRGALWTNVKETAEQRIQALGNDLEVNKEVVKLAEKIIEEEKE